MERNIAPGDVIIGRKNKDLLEIYKDFTLHKHREIKFKNKGLVDAIIKDINECVRDYMINYAKGKNIDREAYAYMDEFGKLNGVTPKSKLWEVELSNFISKYAKEHKEELQAKAKTVMKSHQTIDYLVKCMKEYHDDGAYAFEENNNLTVYYETILEFIEEYKKSHSSILSADFQKYMEHFLNASTDKYNVPVISSVHSMKGGEASTVYIYDFPRFPYKWSNQTREDEQQELNLQYVAVTRAKKNLHLMLLQTHKAKTPELEEMWESQNADCEARVSQINRLVDDLNASKYGQ